VSHDAVLLLVLDLVALLQVERGAYLRIVGHLLSLFSLSVCSARLAGEYAPAFVRRLRAANEATTPGFIPLLKKKLNFLRYFFLLLWFAPQALPTRGDGAHDYYNVQYSQGWASSSLG